MELWKELQKKYQATLMEQEQSPTRIYLTHTIKK